MAIRPTKVRSFSSSNVSGRFSGSVFSAKASTRSPSAEKAAICAWISLEIASSMGTTPVSAFAEEHRPRSTSGAPLVRSVVFPAISCRVDISFLSESKGSSCKRRKPCRISFSSPPALRQNARRAVSVGSPICASSWIAPSLQSTLSPMSSFKGDCGCSSASQTLPSVNAFCTVILFCVSVPVLSEQITETEPSASTARSFLMMAFCFAIFCVPIASPIVTIELNASGIAATASATANINACPSPICRHTPSANTIAQIIRIRIESFLEKSSRLFCKGVSFSCADAIRCAIFPISVSMPVAVTSTTARP